MTKALKPTENLVRDKNNGGRWTARYKLNGRPRYKSLGTTDLGEARKKLKGLMAEVRAVRENRMAEPDARSTILWKDVADAYREDRARYPGNKRTAERYETDIDRIGRFLTANKIRPAEIDLTVVHRFVNWCLGGEETDEDGDEAGLALNSVLNALSAFNRAMQSALLGGVFGGDPKAITAVAALQTYPRMDIKGRAARLRPPLNGEHEKLLPDVERIMPRLLLFAQFLHRSGCRTGELLAAHAEDIQRGEAGLQLYLWRNVKRAKARAILLNAAEELLPLLPKRGRLFPDLPEDVAVVASMWGKFWERRRAEAEATAASEGRPLTDWEERRWRLHDERHAFACESILEGADLYALKEHLGHASVKTTERYTERLRELPVAQRRSLRRLWKGKRRQGGGEGGDGEQPEVVPNPSLMAAEREEFARLRG